MQNYVTNTFCEIRLRPSLGFGVRGLGSPGRRRAAASAGGAAPRTSSSRLSAGSGSVLAYSGQSSNSGLIYYTYCPMSLRMTLRSSRLSAGLGVEDFGSIMKTITQSLNSCQYDPSPLCEKQSSTTSTSSCVRVYELSKHQSHSLQSRA